MRVTFRHSLFKDVDMNDINLPPGVVKRLVIILPFVLRIRTGPSYMFFKRDYLKVSQIWDSAFPLIQRLWLEESETLFHGN